LPERTEPDPGGQAAKGEIMVQGSASQMTSSGLALLAASVAIGMGFGEIGTAFGGGGTYALVAGIAMLILLAIGYLSQAW
jgi:hypothetical protein